MTGRTDRERLADARRFIVQVQGHAGGLDAETLAQAPQPLHAALYGLTVIGEALSYVSPTIKALAPEIRWRSMTSMRNILVHAYWQVDLTIVADVVENELPRLDGALVDLQRRIEISDA